MVMGQRCEYLQKFKKSVVYVDDSYLQGDDYED